MAPHSNTLPPRHTSPVITAVGVKVHLCKNCDQLEFYRRHLEHLLYHQQRQRQEHESQLLQVEKARITELTASANGIINFSSSRSRFTSSAPALTPLTPLNLNPIQIHSVYNNENNDILGQATEKSTTKSSSPSSQAESNSPPTLNFENSGKSLLPAVSNPGNNSLTLTNIGRVPGVHAHHNHHSHNGRKSHDRESSNSNFNPNSNNNNNGNGGWPIWTSDSSGIPLSDSASFNSQSQFNSNSNNNFPASSYSSQRLDVDGNPIQNQNQNYNYNNYNPGGSGGGSLSYTNGGDGSYYPLNNGPGNSNGNGLSPFTGNGNSASERSANNGDVTMTTTSPSSTGPVVIVRGEEIGIVLVVLLLWVGAIILFFNRWGKIRMLEPYQPKFCEAHRPSCPMAEVTSLQQYPRTYSKFNISTELMGSPHFAKCSYHGVPGYGALGPSLASRPRQNSVFVTSPHSAAIAMANNTVLLQKASRKTKSAIDLSTLVLSEEFLENDEDEEEESSLNDNDNDTITDQSQSQSQSQSYSRSMSVSVTDEKDLKKAENTSTLS